MTTDLALGINHNQRAVHRRYDAYGLQRSGSNELGTDHTFTGQKADGTGLMYYNARYYDPEIGQFIWPDSIVPDPTNVFAYNRYMYVYGNPLKYSDPSGHCALSDDGSRDANDGECWGLLDQFASSSRGGHSYMKDILELDPDEWLEMQETPESNDATVEWLKYQIDQGWSYFYSRTGAIPSGSHAKYYTTRVMNPMPEDANVPVLVKGFASYVVTPIYYTCQEVDCITLTLDVVGVAATGAILAACIPGPAACATVATVGGAIGSTATLLGVGYTIRGRARDDGSVSNADLMITVTIATASAATGNVFPKAYTAQFVYSGTQLIYDTIDNFGPLLVR